MKPVLLISELTKEYKNKCALSDFTMQIEKGEIVALIGENGAGKTTLLNTICGFTKPSSGTIYFMGKDIKEQKKLDKIGILIEPAFFDYLSAEENLKYISKLSGNSSDNKKIEELLQQTELYDSRKKKVKSFSFGMKQRLGLCQSLLADVELLIFDEPFVGLDPIGKELFKKVIISKAHEEKIPVLFSSHDLDDVEEICDRVVMIQKGEKIVDQKIIKKKIYELRIDGIISIFEKQKLEAKDKNIHCEGSKVFFSDEKQIIDVQKILLEEGHYIVGMSIHTNNLKNLFLKGKYV